MPRDPEPTAVAPGSEHENLQGWIPPLASEHELRAALEKAFDYRGDVTLTLEDGSRIEGYIFDRNSDGPSLADCRVRLLPREGADKVSISYASIARLEFTGRDTAAGKSFETWVRNYRERKRAGETNVRLEPEELD